MICLWIHAGERQSKSVCLVPVLVSYPMMVCELFLLSSVWFLFVIFWMETISVWLFLCNFYQDRAFYHWGDGVFADDPGHMLYMLGRVDGSGRIQT
ncbi:hypothetical protein JZ751_017051 [Albula glossodonta]|uniref:Uncharacterized protein n=2 Tax=Albula glossodonta TaxID=121402 RepID=A0A8T2NNW6_9TELE|nr:hypothetical protein JZ751_017051 [Albula glossodonta]